MPGSAAHTTQQSQALGTRLLSSSGTADQDNAAYTQAHTQSGQQQLQHSSMSRPQGSCGPALPERPSGILRQGLVGSSQGGQKESSAPPHAGIIRDIRPAHQACLPSWMHKLPDICPSMSISLPAYKELVLCVRQHCVPSVHTLAAADKHLPKRKLSRDLNHCLCATAADRPRAAPEHHPQPKLVCEGKHQPGRAAVTAAAACEARTTAACGPQSAA